MDNVVVPPETNAADAETDPKQETQDAGEQKPNKKVHISPLYPFQYIKLIEQFHRAFLECLYCRPC